MSASPGAYVTSLPQQTWIKIAKGRLLWYVYGTFTSSVSYYTMPPWHELPLGVSNTGSVEMMIDVIVTSVSGTSPAMTVSTVWFDPIEFLNGITSYSLPLLNVPSSGSITSTGIYSNTGTFYGYFAIQVSINISGTSPSFTAYVVLQIVG